MTLLAMVRRLCGKRDGLLAVLLLSTNHIPPGPPSPNAGCNGRRVAVARMNTVPSTTASRVVYRLIGMLLSYKK